MARTDADGRARDPGAQPGYSIGQLRFAGRHRTVMTRLWVALVPTPLEAVMASV